MHSYPNRQHYLCARDKSFSIFTETFAFYRPLTNCSLSFPEDEKAPLQVTRDAPSLGLV